MDTSQLGMRFDSSSSSYIGIGFISAHQGSLSILEHGSEFFESARHIFMLYPSKTNILNGFIKGLSFPFYLESEHVIATKSLFSQVVEYMRAIERECIETYKGGRKRTCHHYSVIVILSRRKDPSGEGQLYV